MRRGLALFLLVNVAIIFFLVGQVWTLLSLLVVDGSQDAISRAELPAPNSSLIDGRRQLIPKIIHQTYKNETIPEVWKEAQRSCIELHPDYEYKLWTDDSAREFIVAEYPWFLDTWDGYPFNIQRADAIRYFILSHFGGIYIDLDDGCNRRLDPLLSYSAWLRRTLPTGISNDAMGSVPQHPFFLRVIDSLSKYNRSWFLPYITVMASTGPLFLSVMWRHYNNDDPVGDDRIRILFPDEYKDHVWSFFVHNVGNSWHEKDVQFIMWLRSNWLLVTIFGFVIAGFAFSGSYWLYRRWCLGGYGSGPGSPRKRYHPNSRSFLRRLPILRYFSKGDRAGSYELLDRRDV
ncbi:hypothetical protein P152DRAFT_42162 [Eremomyces bilateralis CBS 781.70]|uniref:Mannosyl phosphorylinositol ceramide synthase SUR1 n=1 Tax=Eremomyces bilateralis CBS 781.70 TaxID=1392243 RepID=A0A6G1G1T2_9PEZI|nr:uncharacterized protein P152DRAFT_42162 [Eremomyces bilateralis CBS 781.70]KAF1812014.1 hypothetical protein P152DRAFT_42162 [Eremomyces bilateralis CBS 781.70]